MPDPMRIRDVFAEIDALNMLGGLGDDTDEYGLDRDEMDEAEREDWERDEHETIFRRPRRRVQ